MALIVNKGKEEESDERLIQMYSTSHDAQVIGRLFQRYISLVYGLCLKYFKNEQDSKDAVMDIYQLVARKLKEHQVDHFKSWLYVLSKNHCLGKLRTAQKNRIKETDAAFMYSDQVFHLDTVDSKDVFSTLEHCMKVLPKEQKMCIQQFYFEKKSYQKIVDDSEFDWNQVRSFIQNGRRNLKKCIEKNNG